MNTTKDNKLNNKRVLILQQRGWGLRIGHFLAKKLKEEGCRFAAFTLKKTTHQFVMEQKDIHYDLVINIDNIVEKPLEYLQGETFSLKEICQALGVASIWPAVAGMRAFTRSYKDKYYYGFKQNVSDEEIINYIMAVYKAIKAVFEKFQPEVIITPNFADLFHIMLNLYAEKRGVKMISLTDSKLKGVCIFSYSYNDDQGPFFKRLAELNLGKVISENIDKAKLYIEQFRKEFEQPDNIVALRVKPDLKKIIRHQLSPYYHILKWYLKRSVNVLDNVGITPDFRPPKIILRDHYCHGRYKKFMEKFNYYPFDQLGKFIYFPLQFQPEATIDVIAPYFNNQIETIRQVAMSLPDDYTLAVKEHPAMVGLRPPSYLQKIDRTPNVKLIDYRLSSEKILKSADMIISPSGTTLIEAAFYNKPAIQLGNLGVTFCLPNVTKHTDMTTLSNEIQQLLKQDLTTSDYQKQFENYIAAIYDTGYPFDYWGVWEQGKPADMDFFWQIWRQEIKTNII